MLLEVDLTSRLAPRILAADCTADSIAEAAEEAGWKVSILDGVATNLNHIDVDVYGETVEYKVFAYPLTERLS